MYSYIVYRIAAKILFSMDMEDPGWMYLHRLYVKNAESYLEGNY